MVRLRYRETGRNWKVFRRQVFGHTFAMYGWSKHRGMIAGRVLRLGPLGHFQVQVMRTRRKNGRRAQREIQFSAWGVTGRRGKHFVRFAVTHTLKPKPRPIQERGTVIPSPGQVPDAQGGNGWPTRSSSATR